MNVIILDRIKSCGCNIYYRIAEAIARMLSGFSSPVLLTASAEDIPLITTIAMPATITYSSGLLVISENAEVATLDNELRGVINTSDMPCPIAPVILLLNLPMVLPGAFSIPMVRIYFDYIDRRFCFSN